MPRFDDKTIAPRDSERLTRAVGPCELPIGGSASIVAVAMRRGCRISPRPRPFVVDVSNGLGATRVDVAQGRSLVIAFGTAVGVLYNAVDLCDSLRRGCCAKAPRATHRIHGGRSGPGNGRYGASVPHKRRFDPVAA